MDHFTWYQWLMFIFFIIAILFALFCILWGINYMFDDCLRVGHTKLYCILDNL